MFRYLRKHFGAPWPVEALFGLGLLLRAGFEVVLNAAGALGGRGLSQQRERSEPAPAKNKVLQKV